MTRPRYISDKGIGKLLQGKSICYHHDPRCNYATRGGGTAVELQEQDNVSYAKQLAPCSLCAGGTPRPKPAPETLPPTIWPQKEEIPIWRCSDGTVFHGERGEAEALWHQLELTKSRVNGRARTKAEELPE